MEGIEKIVNVIKKQAEAFLLDAGEFYPFGTCLDKIDRIIPVGAYLEGEYPSSADLIDLLENGFKKGINSGDYQIAVMAIDILISDAENRLNGIELRFFEAGKEVYKRHFRYVIRESHVEFIEYND